MSSLERSLEEENMPWELGVFDAHCHPTDTMSSINCIPRMKAQCLTIMATRAEDQDSVAQTAEKYGFKEDDRMSATPINRRCGVIPSFGWHPWFSHQLYDDFGQEDKEEASLRDKILHYKSVLSPQLKDDHFAHRLPNPRPLSSFLAMTESYLKKYPLAVVGEVGLDRAFRIPNAWSEEEQANRDKDMTPGSREGRSLSPYHVNMSHQKKILKAQLQLAGKLGRPVSVHSVQSHGAVFEVLEELWKGHEKEVISKRQRKRRGSVEGAHAHEDERSELAGPTSGTTRATPYPPRICLHSYSGPPEPLQQFLRPSIPSDIFFSFSDCINFSNPSTEKAEQVIRALHESRILVESDLHIAGEEMDARLECIVRKVCQIKGWRLDEGVRTLGENWRRFLFGE